MNHEVLAEMIAAMKAVGERLARQPPTLDGILALRGVLEMADAELDADVRARLGDMVLGDLDRALAELVAARAREGSAIAAVLGLRLDEIERLSGAAEASPARQPDADPRPPRRAHRHAARRRTGARS